MFAEITPKGCFQGAPLHWSENDLYVEILCLVTMSNCLCQITVFRTTRVGTRMMIICMRDVFLYNNR